MLKTINNVEISSLVGVISDSFYDVETRLAPITGESRASRLCRSIGFYKTRYFDYKYTTLDATILGSKFLLENTNINAEDIDCMISCTSSPDFISPANSFILQKELGIKSSAMCFDILQGCAGFIYALYQASCFIDNGSCKHVLIAVGDCSCIRDFKGEDQVQNAAIFADGAAVCLVSYNEQAKPLTFNLTNYGDLWDVITLDHWSMRKTRTIESGKPYNAHGAHIDGIRLAGFIVDKVVQNIKDLMINQNLTFDDLSYCIAHQANKNILQSLEHALKAPKGFIPFVCKDIGNTGAASIPISLSAQPQAYQEIKNKPSIMSGFGVGLSIGSAICDLSNTQIFPELYLK